MKVKAAPTQWPVILLTKKEIQVTRVLSLDEIVGKGKSQMIGPQFLSAKMPFFR